MGAEKEILEFYEQNRHKGQILITDMFKTEKGYFISPNLYEKFSQLNPFSNYGIMIDDDIVRVYYNNPIKFPWKLFKDDEMCNVERDLGYVHDANIVNDIFDAYYENSSCDLIKLFLDCLPINNMTNKQKVKKALAKEFDIWKDKLYDNPDSKLDRLVIFYDLMFFDYDSVIDNLSVYYAGEDITNHEVGLDLSPCDALNIFDNYVKELSLKGNFKAFGNICFNKDVCLSDKDAMKMISELEGQSPILPGNFYLYNLFSYNKFMDDLNVHVMRDLTESLEFKPWIEMSIENLKEQGGQLDNFLETIRPAYGVETVPLIISSEDPIKERGFEMDLEYEIRDRLFNLKKKKELAKKALDIFSYDIEEYDAKTEINKKVSGLEIDNLSQVFYMKNKPVNLNVRYFLKEREVLVKPEISADCFDRFLDHFKTRKVRYVREFLFDDNDLDDILVCDNYDRVKLIFGSFDMKVSDFSVYSGYYNLSFEDGKFNTDNWYMDPDNMPYYRSLKYKGTLDTYNMFEFLDSFNDNNLTFKELSLTGILSKKSRKEMSRLNTRLFLNPVKPVIDSLTFHMRYNRIDLCFERDFSEPHKEPSLTLNLRTANLGKGKLTNMLKLIAGSCR